MKDPRPVIALTADYIPDKEYHYMTNAYLKAVRLAGGVPVVLCPAAQIPADFSGSREEFLSRVDVESEILDRVDGVIFAGGYDVDPAFYGDPVLVQNGYVSPWRDAWEIRLVKTCMDRGMPIFGICRGIQLLGAALGAKLHQDVAVKDKYDTPDFDPSRVLQHEQKAPNWYGMHEITTMPGSRLARIMGERAWVNSFHHQAIATVPEGAFSVTAHATDGTIEGIEISSYPYFVGVQWHPERMTNDPKMRMLFQEFAGACSAYRKKEAQHGYPRG